MFYVSKRVSVIWQGALIVSNGSGSGDRHLKMVRLIVRKAFLSLRFTLSWNGAYGND